MSDFKKIYSLDPRISQAKPIVEVSKGASSISSQTFQYLTASNNQHVVSIIIPSLQTVVDRYLLLQTTFRVQFKVTAPSNPSSVFPLSQGSIFGLASWPYHRLISSTTCSINDSSVTTNYSQCLQSLLRVIDDKEWRQTATTPSMLDKTALCSTLGTTSTGGSGYTLSTANPYSDANSLLDGSVPNGSFKITYLDSTGDVLNGSGAYDYNGVSTNFVNGVPVSSTTQTGFWVFAEVTVTEPYMQSPFVFSKQSLDYSTGLSGITAIQITSQMQSPAAANIIKQLNPSYTISNLDYFVAPSASSAFSNSFAALNFLTPQLSVFLPKTNIVPFQEIITYPFSSQQAIPAGSTAVVRSNTVTLNQIPEYLIVQIKPQSYSPVDGDWLLPVQSASITFDNITGIQANATQQQLYRMSYENGSKMSWNEWSGQANLSTAAGAIQTVGGPLVLKFGKDIQLFSGLAPSVNGNFSLQVSCNVANYYNDAVTPQITLIVVSTGVFTSEGGRSSRTTMLVTEKDVLEPTDGEIEDGSISTMIGVGKKRVYGKPKHQKGSGSMAGSGVSSGAGEMQISGRGKVSSSGSKHHTIVARYM